MKKILILLFLIYLCASSVFALSSCTDENEEDMTEKVELKEFADAELVDQINEDMTREDVHKLLDVEPFTYETNYGGPAEVYRLTDGCAAYINYYNKTDKVMYITVKKMIDPALIDKIKEGYPYNRITEIFGGIDGIIITSSGLGPQLYILNDGRLLHINYDTCDFATSITIISENGERILLYTPEQERYNFDNIDGFKQHLISTYKDKEAKIAIPKLVTDEYELDMAVDSRDSFGYYYSHVEHGTSDQQYSYQFSVEVYKIDIMYEDMVNYYKSNDRNEVIECKDGVTFVKNWGRFLLNNNGRVITVDIPLTLREDSTYLRDENSPPAITTLAQLNEYLVIEYLDLPVDNGAEE